MSQQETIEEVVKDMIETVVKEKADSVCEKIEDRIPEPIAKVIETSLTGVAVSCGCLGWKFSVEKLSHKTPQK